MRRALAAGAAAVAAAVVLGASVPPAAAAEPAGRVLVITVPGLTWADVRDHDLPAMRTFVGDAALANLAPRGVEVGPTAGAAYLTISAGARATSDPRVDGQQLAVDEPAGTSSAGDVFTRRTGVEPDGGYVALAWPTLERRNADQPYEAEPGLLADTLARAGRGVEVIGNADGSDTAGPSYERQVALAAATGEGVIPAGRLDGDLLARDPASPFGVRLDRAAVVERVEDALAAPGGREGGLVVVEASDLARVMRYRDRVDEDRYRTLRSAALADTDALVGELLDRVDPERDAVLLVAPYNLPGDRDLTVAALRGPGVGPGFMRSASTQRTGFLTLVDVAPTVLDQLGIARPEAMEGRPAEVTEAGGTAGARLDRMVDANAAARFREQLLTPTTVVAVVGMAALCAATVVVVARGRPGRARRIVAGAALAELALFPLSYGARALPLEDLGAGVYWAVLIVGAAALAVAATALGGARGREDRPLAAVLAVVLAVPLADVVLGSHLSLNAAFGYSATGNSRLYGISNYSFGQVAASSCLVAALVAARWPGRRGRVAAIGLLVAVLVVIGWPTWGSDVGGILAFTPTVLVFAALVTGYRLRLRTAVAAVAATGLVVVSFGLLDLARPAGERGHLGRLFERIGDEGLTPLWSLIDRKLAANLAVSTTSLWLAAIPVAVAFGVFLARYPGRPLAGAAERVPTLRAGIVAALVAAALGSAVNDSGAIVGAVTLTVLSVALAWLAVGAGAEAPPAGAGAAEPAPAEAEPPAPPPDPSRPPTAAPPPVRVGAEER
jgi:hypothetical protein